QPGDPLRAQRVHEPAQWRGRPSLLVEHRFTIARETVLDLGGGGPDLGEGGPAAMPVSAHAVAEPAPGAVVPACGRGSRRLRRSRTWPNACFVLFAPFMPVCYLRRSRVADPC